MVLLSQCEKSANKLFSLQFKSLTAFRGNTFLFVGHNSLHSPPPLRLVSLLAIGGPRTSDQFLHKIYGSLLRSVSLFTIWGPFRLVSLLTIWGPLRSVSVHTFLEAPLRSVFSLSIWGPFRSFFCIVYGVPSDQFICIPYRGPLRSISSLAIWEPP